MAAPTAVALTGNFDHALARATLTAVPRPAGDGRWRVTITARLKGRSFARLVLPLGMAFVGRRARGLFAKALDDAAREWNDRVPELVRKDAEQLRLAVAESLVAVEAEPAAQETGGNG